MLRLVVAPVLRSSLLIYILFLSLPFALGQGLVSPNRTYLGIPLGCTSAGQFDSVLSDFQPNIHDYYRCEYAARNSSYKYFGLKNGDECWLSNTLKNPNWGESCHVPCTFDSRYICGGLSAFLVYQVSYTYDTSCELTRTSTTCDFSTPESYCNYKCSATYFVHIASLPDVYNPVNVVSGLDYLDSCYCDVGFAKIRTTEPNWVYGQYFESSSNFARFDFSASPKNNNFEVTFYRRSGSCTSTYTLTFGGGGTCFGLNYPSQYLPLSASSSSKTPIIVGASLGGFFLFVIVIVLTCYVVKRRSMAEVNTNIPL